MARQFDRNRHAPPKSRALKWLAPLAGLLGLVWFVVRVIPKPSRATYPCQRVAFPLASGFVIWLAAALASIGAYRRAKEYLHRCRYLLAAACLMLAVGGLWLALNVTADVRARADEPERNVPVGIGKGIHPGRVVWVHDPNATDWKGPYENDGHPWEPNHTKQDAVDKMVSQAVQSLAGKDSDEKAWDAIFSSFNESRGRGNRGYKRNEKIAIKINLTTCNFNAEFWNVDSSTYEKMDNLDASDTSPQIIIAVLRQLVNVVGVRQSDIAVADTLAYFPNHYWRICHGEFPKVHYVDSTGRLGRAKPAPSNVQLHFSDAQASENEKDYLPKCFAEADYLLNIAVLKSHDIAGVTLCAKNHYGSLARRPIEYGFYDLHQSLAGYHSAKGSYRALVDLMGHSQLGGKTLLYIIDGLYAGYNWDGEPRKWRMEPFNNDWPSSIFVSQDPVAIDCVGLDFLWEEWPDIVRIEAVDDYLLEAAHADQAFYDPDGSGKKLKSLGVYERWNNPKDKKYSRNLGTGAGIELLYLGPAK